MTTPTAATQARLTGAQRAALDPALRYVLDRIEIQDLMARYGMGQDLHQPYLSEQDVLEQWDDVFTPDATVDYSASGAPDPGVGYRDLARHMRGPKMRGDGSMRDLTAFQHLEGVATVRIEGDTATAMTPHLHTHRSRDELGRWNLMEAGTFHDDLIRTERGWRIQHRRLEILWLDVFDVQDGDPIPWRRPGQS
jgi:hypothetical protein